MDSWKRYFDTSYEFSRELDEYDYSRKIWNVIKFKRVMKLCGNVKGRDILDVGCGGGIFSIALAKKGARVTSIDLMEEAVGSVNSWARDENLKVETEVSSLEEFPTEKRFDVILALDSIMYTDDVVPAARKLAKLLKPCGRLIVSVPNTWQMTSLISLADYFPMSIIKKLRFGHNRNYSRHLPWVWLGFFRQAGLRIEERACCYLMPPYRSKHADEWLRRRKSLQFVLLNFERIFYKRFPIPYMGQLFIFSARKTP